MMTKVEVTRKRWICGYARGIKGSIRYALEDQTNWTKRSAQNTAICMSEDPDKVAKATITVTVEWDEKK